MCIVCIGQLLTSALLFDFFNSSLTLTLFDGRTKVKMTGIEKKKKGKFYKSFGLFGLLLLFLLFYCCCWLFKSLKVDLLHTLNVTKGYYCSLKRLFNWDSVLFSFVLFSSILVWILWKWMNMNKFLLFCFHSYRNKAKETVLKPTTYVL